MQSDLNDVKLVHLLEEQRRNLEHHLANSNQVKDRIHHYFAGVLAALGLLSAQFLSVPAFHNHLALGSIAIFVGIPLFYSLARLWLALQPNTLRTPGTVADENSFNWARNSNELEMLRDIIEDDRKTAEAHRAESFCNSNHLKQAYNGVGFAVIAYSVIVFASLI